MREYNFGSIDNRELCLRLYAPYCFTRWDGATFKLSLLLLLNPLRWWRAILGTGQWDWWIARREGNHRCYCPIGVLFDGRICVAGFGVTWFYSRFDGDVPCPCDDAIEEVFPEQSACDPAPGAAR